jgi:hypothetical protein
MMHLSTLWAYWTFDKTTMGFTPFQLLYGIEPILSIECEIQYLKLVIELLHNTSAKEERLLYLMKLDKTHRDSSLVIDTHKKHFKDQYYKHVKPRVFF